MTTNESLLTEIERFCAKNDVSHSRFGRMFFNNASFVRNLATNSVSPTLKTIHKMRVLMKNYKPKKEKKDGK